MTERDELIRQAHAVVGGPRKNWRDVIREQPVWFFGPLTVLMVAVALAAFAATGFVSTRQNSDELSALRSENACARAVGASTAVAQGRMILALGDYVSTEGALVDALARRDQDRLEGLVASLGDAAARLAAAKAVYDSAIGEQSRVVATCGK